MLFRWTLRWEGRLYRLENGSIVPVVQHGATGCLLRRRDWRRVAQLTAVDISLRSMPLRQLECVQRRATWLKSAPILIRRCGVLLSPHAYAPLRPVQGR